MKRLAVIAVFLLVFVSGSSWADPVITSDLLEQEGEVYTFTGNVIVTNDDTHIKADSAIYNATSRSISAKSIKQETNEMKMHADGIEMSLVDSSATVYNASVSVNVKQESYRIASDKIERHRDGRYVLHNAFLTTCDSPLPAWCIKSRRIDVLIGDRLEATLVRLEVKGVPVIFLPYIWAPALTERTTGLLIPTFGYNSLNGVYLRLPIFLNLAPNRDVTLFIENHSKKGFGQAIEYRYIERADNKGTIYGFHIKDDLVNTDFYEISSHHEQDDLRINVNYVNRKDYLRLYKPYLAQSSQRYLESNFQAETKFDVSRIFLRSRYLIELDPGKDQSSVVQRLPEAGYASKPFGIWDGAVSVAASVTNFDRELGTKGQRFSVEANGAYSVGKTVTLFQGVQAREYLYRLDSSKTDRANRHSADYTASLGTTLSRKYASFSHLITPTATYGYSLRSGYDGTFFDSVEIPIPHSKAELWLTNRLIANGVEFLTVAVGAHSDSSGGEDMRAGFSLRGPVEIRTTIYYNFSFNGFSEADTDISYAYDSQKVGVGQRYSRIDGIQLYSAWFIGALTKTLSVEGHVWYDSISKSATETTAGFKYSAQCWGADVLYTKRPGNFSYFFMITLKGLGTIKS